jgi:hypothetical protein
MNGALFILGSIGYHWIVQKSCQQRTFTSSVEDGKSKVKKSPVYTRTGDKGTTSVRDLLVFICIVSFSLLL